MTHPRQPKGAPRFGEERLRTHEAEERWREAGYKPQVIERLRWNRRYSVVRIGGFEFAFSSYDDYLAALRAVWAAGLVPDHGPSSVLGIDLPDAAPSLRGVDVDLTSQASLGPETGTR